MNPIKPTVGRIVYFTPAAAINRQSIMTDYQTGVCAAIVTAVHNDNCVNLAVFDANGNQYTRTSVCHVSTLPEVAAGDVNQHDYWDWMPYQKEQAKKHADKPASDIAAPLSLTSKPVYFDSEEAADIAEALSMHIEQSLKELDEDGKPVNTAYCNYIAGLQAKIIDACCNVVAVEGVGVAEADASQNGSFSPANS